ncbi:MAG: hypothetical protein V1934_07505 [Methanobacteriota archaeon]
MKFASITSVVLCIFVLNTIVFNGGQIAMAAPNTLSIQNVPPEISSFIFSKSNEYDNIALTVIDYNSWQDISNISIRILDSNNNTLSLFMFEQYENLSINVRINRFNEIIGNENIVLNLCNVSRPESGEDYIVRTTLTVYFVFHPFRNAQSIDILINDLGGLSASIQTPYNFVGNRSSFQIWIFLASIMLAIAIATLVGKKRYNRNRLLEIIDEKYGEI